MRVLLSELVAKAVRNLRTAATGEDMAQKFVMLIAALLMAGSAAAAPGVGDLAPDWTLPGSDGQQHTLADLRGKHVVVAFFPKAFTGG